ncbi:MAG: caspase family protein [Saprospiraceae bacterium]|nr:caspase family protein [Candidatus Vicinibacter affinis]
MRLLFLSVCSILAFGIVRGQEKGMTPVVPNGVKETGVTRAVIVGISDYQNVKITDLQFADRDALAFANYLKSEAGGKVDSSHITLLLNEKATAGQFVSALYGLMEESKEGDLVIIYFSGHGDVESTTISQPGFLLCWDAPARVYMGGGTFGLSYLQEVISTLALATKAKVLVITDACRAGKLAGSSIGGSQATAANLSKQYANEVKIMSCQPDELSLEGKSWGGGRGVFSYYFLAGVQGLADKNNDGAVNLAEIERYLGDKVPTAVAPHSQIPMTIGNKNTVLSKVDPKILEELKSLM